MLGQLASLQLIMYTPRQHFSDIQVARPTRALADQLPERSVSHAGATLSANPPKSATTPDMRSIFARLAQV